MNRPIPSEARSTSPTPPARPGPQHRDLEHTHQQRTVDPRWRRRSAERRETLPAHDLPGIDRRHPEKLDHAAGPLADEREGDKRHREVLQDKGEDGRAEVGEDPRLRRGSVRELGRVGAATTSGGMAAAPGSERSPIALALLGRAGDDRPVDRVRRAPRRGSPRNSERTGSTASTRTSMTDCLPARNCGLGVLRGDDQDVELPPVRPASPAARSSRRPAWESATGQLLVGLDVGRQPGRRRRDDYRLERALDAAVAETEKGHDQERAEDQTEERAGPPNGLDELLAD